VSPPSSVTVSQLRVLATGLDHPEGVALGPDGMLYAGGEAGQVYRVDPNAVGAEQIAETGGSALGVALDGQANVFICDLGLRAVVRVSSADGSVDRWCESAGGAALRTPNWAAFAPDGSLWFSDSGTEDVAVRDGLLVRIPPGGGDGEIMELPALHYPNGLAVAPDGTLYVLESLTPRLSALRGDHLETVSELPGVVPDGVSLTADGDFVIGCYYPFHMLYVDSGRREVSILLEDATATYLRMPTNTAFFGAERRSLAIASLGGRTLFALDGLPFAGAPLHQPTQP